MNSVVSKFLDVQEFILSHPYTFGTLAAGAGALTVVYAVSSWCLRRRKCESNACLDDKVVIITGANTGIGYETALNLATRNARVILACRNVAKGETAAAEVRKKTGNGNVVFRHLDLASIRSIRRFAAEILEEETKIDILVNNAGLIESDFLKTEDGFEMIFGVNHLGHFHLTNLLINRLKESPAARIVVVSAYMQGYKESFDFDLVNRSTLRRTGLVRVSYAQSKLANWLFTKALARRLEGGRVTVNALHPGFINTEMSDDIANIMPIWIRVSFLDFRALIKIWKSPGQIIFTNIVRSVTIWPMGTHIQ